MNLSLGHPVGESYTTDPLCQAVEAAWKAGIVVVCAAGNNGRAANTANTAGAANEGWGTAYGSIKSPGNDPYVITVGATEAAWTAAAPTTGSPPTPAAARPAWIWSSSPTSSRPATRSSRWPRRQLSGDDLRGGTNDRCR